MVTLLGALLNNESGGRNVVQGDIGDINNKTGDLAKGYFQITDATWRDFGGLNTGYARAIDAPYDVQAQVAGNIPLKRWGPNTITAMRATGRPIDLSRTLGENLSMSGEGFGNAPSLGDGQAQQPLNGQAQHPLNGQAQAPLAPGVQGPVAPQFQGPTAPQVQGPTAPQFQGPVAPAAPTAVAENDSWRKRLGKAIAGYKAPAIAKDTGAAGLPTSPGAARVDTPEMPSFDPNQIANQRQQLAMAMQRLNSGKLWL